MDHKRAKKAGFVPEVRGLKKSTHNLSEVLWGEEGTSTLGRAGLFTWDYFLDLPFCKVILKNVIYFKIFTCSYFKTKIEFFFLLFKVKK